MNYEAVAKAIDIGELGVIQDFLFDAGLGNCPKTWAKVLREVENDLMPGRSLSGYVGEKVFPLLTGKKNPERWAKNLNLTPRAPRVKRKVRGFLFEPLSRLIDLSAKQPNGSPRKLSDDLIDGLTRTRELSVDDCSEEGADIIVDLLKGVLSERREYVSLLLQKTEAYSDLRESASVSATLAQRLLLSHEPTSSSPDVEKNTVN